MKSLVSSLHLVADAILADCCLAYPSLVGEFVRDKRALASYVDERGLGFFTLDLPTLSSLLLDGLERGSLVLAGPFSKRVSAKIRVPAFMRGLWLLVFNDSGSLRLDSDPTAVAFLRQFFELGKKVTLTCTPARNLAAIKEFVDVERTARRPTLRWEDDELFDGTDVRGLRFSNANRLRQHTSESPTFLLSEYDCGGLSEADAHLLERLDTICRDVSTGFGLLDVVAFDRQLLEAGRPSGTKNGPGAVSDRSRKQEKFCFDIWPDKLQSVFPIDHFGHRPSEQGNTYLNFEHPSKLITVPKTAKTPRLIASEPSYHQWCQQLVKVFLEDGVKTIFGDDFISFRDQSQSWPLVQAGSQDGSLVTVDLAAASDRLSCWAIERAFSSNLSILNAFKACRTRVVGPSKGVDIEQAFLRKFSTMGSALTFPVQSIFFTCVVLACLPGKPRLVDQLRRYRGQVQVYGDDIVMPKTGYADLVKLLTFLGLKVNTSKSFSNGSFRESCGFDAFKGYNVTPVKPRSLDPTTPDGRMSLIELSNNLYLKGFWRASEAARSLLPAVTTQSLPIVGHRSGSCGFVSYTGYSALGLKTRYNRELQRNEVRRTTYISRSKTTEAVGTDYTYQALHSLTSKSDFLPHLAAASRSVLGRVVEAVTRERRSWEVFDEVLCSTDVVGGPERGLYRITVIL